MSKLEGLTRDERDALYGMVDFASAEREDQFFAKLEEIVAAHAAPVEPVKKGDGVIWSGEVDVTEAVQVIYDMAHGSMDWGSGFLSNEEVETVVDFAIAVGWQPPSLPDNSDAMRSLATKYPEQYELFERWPGQVRVRRRGDMW